ncbi:microtubule-associated protein Jupiter isoform X2 [Oratosquilla oratoria]|uniref:microtubule-associated protein Jupiter isoform X2 n=1 Tax=Oratosquilla oratoria TaxID=337810 RepID=UPI003F76C8FF
MATFASYRHVELDRIGKGKKRVLKPPGGGSSILFDDEDDSKKPSNSSGAASSSATTAAASPQPTPAENGAANSDSTVSTPTTAATAVATNGVAETNGNAKAAPPAAPAAAAAGSTSPTTPKPGNIRDTQSRLFGEPTENMSPSSRKVKDHMRSRIFSAHEDNNAHPKAVNGTPNGNPRAVFSGAWRRRDPVTGEGIQSTWDLHAPMCAPCKRKAPANPASGTSTSKSTPEPASQPSRQRVPPGGFSTKLW